MEGIGYLDVIDQLRYILGTVAAFFVFFHNAAPKRNHFWIRAGVGLYGCLLASMGYLGLLWLYKKDEGMLEEYVTLGIIYWMGMIFLMVAYMMFCYQISLGHSLFRGFMAMALEGLFTTILKYVIVAMFMPEFPAEHTIIYILTAVGCYVFIYGIAYHTIARRIQGSKSAEVLSSHKTVVTYILLIIIYSLISDASRGIGEWMILPVSRYQNLEDITKVIQLYSIGVMLLISAIILLLQYYVYEIAVLQREKTLFNNLLNERKLQYEHSKENIDIINQKCHELKRQITALERASEPERQEMIQETKKTVMFYDSVVKTSNEVLNTVLTEKSLLCGNHGINLTCMVNADHLSNIDGVDLYTVLENALDNAIACVQDLEEEEKKAVALSIYERGKMLYMSVENYYEKPIILRNGIPVSSKKNREHYGMGLQTIRMIAKKYGGDIRVTMEDQIFILQVVLPVSGKIKKRR